MMNDDHDSEDAKKAVLAIFKQALRDLKNDDTAVNIKGLNDIVSKKEHFHDSKAYYERIIDSLGYLLQKICVKADDVDDLDVNYFVHKKILNLIESIIEDEKSTIIVASCETFMERLVDILIHFNDIIGKIRSYEVSTRTIEKFTVIHDCLYSILSIISLLFNKQKIFKLSYATLNKTQSFTKMLDALGHSLIIDYGYATQELSLGVCTRVLFYSNNMKDANGMVDFKSFFPLVLQQQFEDHDAVYIMKNTREILDQINVSNPCIKSVEIESFFVEIANKKSKRKSEKLSRSIAHSTWFDLTAIDLLVELNSAGDQVWLPLFKLASVQLNKSKTQLRFVCSEVEDHIWSNLTDEEKENDTKEITFGIQVKIHDSEKLESIFDTLQDTVELINKEQADDFKTLTEKISIASMTDLQTLQTPLRLAETEADHYQKSDQSVKNDEEDIPQFTSIPSSKSKDKKYHNLKKEEVETKQKVDKGSKVSKASKAGNASNVSKVDIVDKVDKVDKRTKKAVVAATRRSPRTSPKTSPSSEKGGGLTMNHLSSGKSKITDSKLGVFDFNDETNSISDEDVKPIAPIVKPKTTKAKAKAPPKEKSKKEPVGKKQETSAAQSHVTRASTRSPVREPPQKQSESFVSKAKMRSPDAKISNSIGSTDTESKNFDVTIGNVDAFETEDIDDDVGDRISEESEYSEHFIESHSKRVKGSRREKIDEQKFSYERSSHIFSSQFTDDGEEEKDENNYNFEQMDLIGDEDDGDEKDDIIMPLVQELMLIQEKRMTKKRIRKMDALLATATQQVTTYCDNWKNSTLAKSPKVNIDTESIKGRTHDFFASFDHDIGDLKREKAELHEIGIQLAKDEKDFRNEIKQVNSFVQTENEKLKAELGKRKRLLVEEIAKQIVPKSKTSKTSASDFMKKFKSKYA